MFVKIRKFKFLKGPNLIAPTKGVNCQFELDFSALKDNKSYLEFIQSSLNRFRSDIGQSPVDLPEGNQLTDSEKIAGFLCYFINAIHANLGVRLTYLRSHGSGDNRKAVIFIEYKYEYLIQRATQVVVDFVNYGFEKERYLTDPSAVGDFLEKGIAAIDELHDRFVPRLELKALFEVLEERRIPWRFRSEVEKILDIGYGRKQTSNFNNLYEIEPHLGFRKTDNKVRTAVLLDEVGLPSTGARKAKDFDDACAIVDEFGFPVVTKPLIGMRGAGVTTDIRDKSHLQEAYERAKELYPEVLVERYLEGSDYRIFVFNGKYAGCLKREVTILKGDGIRSIDELVAEINAEPWRNTPERAGSYYVKKDEFTTNLIKRQGYDWTSIPKAGCEVRMQYAANTILGGSVEPVLEGIHPANIEMAERAAQQFGLKLCGIDFLSKDIGVPYWENGAAICEVNGWPAFSLMSLAGDKALKELAAKGLEATYPLDKSAEMPLVMIIGEDTGFTMSLRKALQEKGLSTSVASAAGAHIGIAPAIFQDKPVKALNAVLYDKCADAIIVEESGENIKKYGLIVQSISYLVILDEPKVGDQPVPRILNLAASVARHGIFCSEDAPSVFAKAQEVAAEYDLECHARSKSEFLNDLVNKISHLHSLG